MRRLTSTGTDKVQDPVETDSEKYVAIFENELVRVLDYSDKPGERTKMHHHPNFVLYALSPFKRKIHLGGGETIHREFKTGDVIWSKAESHIGENIGETNTHALIIELKERK